MAKKIIQRLQALDSASNVMDIRALPQHRLEALGGDYKGCFSIALNDQYRIIFIPQNGNRTDLKTITKIQIISLCIDYH